jgi:hypothetical protein
MALDVVADVIDGEEGGEQVPNLIREVLPL